MACDSCKQSNLRADQFYWDSTRGTYRQPCKKCYSQKISNRARKRRSWGKSWKPAICPLCEKSVKVPSYWRSDAPCLACSDIATNLELRKFIIEAVSKLAYRLEISTQVELKIIAFIEKHAKLLCLLFAFPLCF